jgi:hypothetical protein
MELYINGMLDTFKPFSGAVLSSTKPLTIGREDDVETLYHLLGSVDEVKLWDKEIPVPQIAKLKDQWLASAGIDSLYLIEHLYPNPAKDIIHIEFSGPIQIENISLFNLEGREISGYKVNIQSSGIEIEISQTKSGFYLLRMSLKDGRVITRKIIINAN